MVTAAAPLAVRVARVDELTPQIKGFRLVSADGGPLPGYTPGAHVQVEVPAAPGRRDVVQWRSYSLISFDPAAHTAAGASEYRIAVRREDDGRGGSRFMHEEVHEGHTLTLRAPTNHFPLEDLPEVILLAGGIGITPMISMASALLAQGRPFRLHYSGRSLSQLAYAKELEALVGPGRLQLHADDDPTTRLSIDALLAAAQPRQPVYVCGPAGMIDATLATGQRLGWRREDLHFERFSETAPLEGDQPFEVELKSSGRVVVVPGDRSLLDALADAGVDVMYDCRSGYCGLCQTGVCSGEIDHRDTYLSEGDRQAGRLMQVCVSRARGPRLVLDL